MMLKSNKGRYLATILVSIISKCSFAIAQIYAITVLLSSMGTTAYSHYVSTIAILSVIPLFIITPGSLLVSEIATNRCHLQRNVLATSALSICAINIAFVLSFSYLAFIVASQAFPQKPTAAPVYAHFFPATQLLYFAIIHYTVSGILGVVECFQAALQKHYLLHSATLASSLGTLFMLYAFKGETLSFPAAYAVMNGPPVLLRSISALLFLAYHREFFPNLANINFDAGRKLFIDGAQLNAITTVGAYLCHQLPIAVIAARSSQEGVYLSVTTTLLLNLFGIVSLVFLPLWPIIAKLKADGALAQIRKLYIASVASTFGYTLLVAVVLIAAANPLLATIKGGDIALGFNLRCASAVYFVLLAWEYAHFTILQLLNYRRFSAVAYFLRAGCGIGFVILANVEDAASVFMILSSTSLIFTCFPYFRVVDRLTSSRSGLRAVERSRTINHSDSQTL